MERLLPLTTGILAGLTSIPLTYLAAHRHREIRRLRRASHTLHELIAETHRGDVLGERRSSRPFDPRRGP